MSWTILRKEEPSRIYLAPISYFDKNLINSRNKGSLSALTTNFSAWPLELTIKISKSEVSLVVSVHVGVGGCSFLERRFTTGTARFGSIFFISSGDNCPEAA